MSKNKEKKENIELATCPNCDKEILSESIECPECGQEFEEEEIDELIDENEVQEEISEDIEPPLEIKRTGLIIGLLLSFAGVVGVIGLRSGFIQSLLVGEASPYSGIGPTESIAHIVSIVPTILGLIMILSWGIKNDPIYYKLEMSRKDTPDGIMIKSEDEMNADEDEVFIPNHDEAPSEITELIEDVSEEELDEDVEIEALDELDDLTVDDIEDKIESIEVPASVKKELAEQIRIERCEKMLTAAVILPGDKDKLKALIPTGMSAVDFTEEVKKAIERRKQREVDDNVTADEKASILEDELVVELAELEGALDEDDDLEDQILKEIEDLEDL